MKNEKSEIWNAYTAYADKIVENGFHQIVKVSLNYFLKETDITKAPDPLFESQLQLKPPEILFSPSLNIDDEGDFYEQIEELIRNVYEQCSMIPRVAKHLGQENYQVFFVVVKPIYCKLFLNYSI